MSDILNPLEYLQSLPKYPLFAIKNNHCLNLNNCGVYAIFVEPNNKIYIGSTGVSFNKRLNSHKYRLRRKMHHTIGLQHSFNKYGLDSLFISIVEIVNNQDYSNIESFKDGLLGVEQYWIDLIPSNLSLNCCLIAGSSLGRPVREEDKVVLSLLAKERMRANPHLIEKMVAGTKAWASVEENRIALSERCKKYMHSPEATERRKVSLRSEKTKSLQSLTTKKMWQRPNYRENISKKVKEFYSSSVGKEMQSAKGKKWASIQENKDRNSIKIKKRFEDPEYRRRNKEHLTNMNRKNAYKTSERSKALWADEDHKKLRSLKIQRGKAKKSLPFCLYSPNGEIYVTDSITAFAKQFSLSQSSLGAIVRGVSKSHKLWTGTTLDSWKNVPIEAIRILWAEHDDLP